MVIEMPDGDCTGPRWKRGRGRGQGRGGYGGNYPSDGFFGRIGGFFSGRRGNGQGMQRNYSQNSFYGNGSVNGSGRGNYGGGRGQGHGKGRKGRGGRW